MHIAHAVLGVSNKRNLLSRGQKFKYVSGNRYCGENRKMSRFAAFADATTADHTSQKHGAMEYINISSYHETMDSNL